MQSSSVVDGWRFSLGSPRPAHRAHWVQMSSVPPKFPLSYGGVVRCELLRPTVSRSRHFGFENRGATFSGSLHQGSIWAFVTCEPRTLHQLRKVQSRGLQHSSAVSFSSGQVPKVCAGRQSQRWRHDHVQRHAHSSQSQPKGSHQRRGLADAERLRQDAAQLLEFLAVAVDTATAEKYVRLTMGFVSVRCNMTDRTIGSGSLQTGQSKVGQQEPRKLSFALLNRSLSEVLGSFSSLAAKSHSQ